MDSKRFTSALKPHLDDALNYCRALCAGKSIQEAEDVLQNALLKAYKGFSQLENADRFKSWLFKIITNCFYNQFRMQFWKRFIPLDEKENSFPDIYTTSPDMNLSMKYALMNLSRKERVAVLLFEIGGFTVKEISVLQKENSISAVKSRLSRARKKMKNYLMELDLPSRKNPYVTSNTLLGDLQYETIQMAEKTNIKE